MAKRQRHIDLKSESGPPTITTGELSRVTGVPVRTIQQDIIDGDLRAARRWQGTHYRISWQEARKYAASVGAL